MIINTGSTLGNFIRGWSKPIMEAVRSRDLQKAGALINSYLLKKRIFTLPTHDLVKIDGVMCLTVDAFATNGMGATFLWELGDTSQIVAVGFTKDFTQYKADAITPDARLNWDVYVEAKGTNIVQMCKLVEQVLSGKVQMDAKAIRAHILDAQLFESVADVNEAIDVQTLQRKRDSMYYKLSKAKKAGSDYTSLQAEYDAIAKELANAKLAVRNNQKAVAVADQDIESIQSQFEEEVRATPEERFEDMTSYIYNVIFGTRPFALLCGAPGVGKTFRVKQAIKGQGLVQDKDWKLLKGKCTPTNLYMTLHDFKKKGQLVVMDDCDSVFGDADAINLLKAAFDSDDERWVSWGIARPIPMDVETAELSDDAVFDPATGKYYYPKQFLYEGGGVIITNFRAGQIDTAVRNRALICDLDFTTNEILDLIRGLAPKIMADTLPMEAKNRAINYLQELADKNAPVDLSIRSFTLCAGLFASGAPERQVQRMISEQMRLQSMRGGKKY